MADARQLSVRGILTVGGEQLQRFEFAADPVQTAQGTNVLLPLSEALTAMSHAVGAAVTQLIREEEGQAYCGLG